MVKNKLIKKIFPQIGTDQGSLIRIFDYGYCTVWKFSNFSATLIFREINFGRVQKIKGATLTILKALNFDFWKHFTLEMSKVPKNANSELLKRSKWQVLGL